MARFYDVFPNPPQNAHLGSKLRVLKLTCVLGSCAGRPTMICLARGVLEVIQHGTHCPQSPWPEEQRWLKRKRLSAHPNKSCRLNCVVTQHKAAERTRLSSASSPPRLSRVISTVWFSRHRRAALVIAIRVVCEQLTFTPMHARVEEVDRWYSIWAVAHALLGPWSCTRQDGTLTQVPFAVVAL